MTVDGKTWKVHVEGRWRTTRPTILSARQGLFMEWCWARRSSRHFRLKDEQLAWCSSKMLKDRLTNLARVYTMDLRDPDRVRSRFSSHGCPYPHRKLNEIDGCPLKMDISKGTGFVFQTFLAQGFLLFSFSGLVYWIPQSSTSISKSRQNNGTVPSIWSPPMVGL